MVILHRFQGELLNCTSFDKEHHGTYVVLVPVCAVFYGALHNALGKRLRVVVLIVCNEVAQPLRAGSRHTCLLYTSDAADE